MSHRPPLPTIFYGRRKKKPKTMTNRLAQAIDDLSENKKAKREHNSSTISPSISLFSPSQVPVEKSETATPSEQQRLPKTRPHPLSDKSNVVASFASPSVPSPLKSISPSVVVQSVSAPISSSPRTQSSSATRRRNGALVKPFVWVDKEDTVNVKRGMLKEQAKEHKAAVADDNRGHALKSKQQLVKSKIAKEKSIITAEKQIPVDGPSTKHSTAAEDYGFATAKFIHDDSRFESSRDLPSDSDMDIPASEGPSINEFVPVPRPTSQATRLDDDVRPPGSFSTVCAAVSTPVVGPRRFYHRSVRAWIDEVGIADQDASDGHGPDRIDEHANTEADARIDIEADPGVDEAENLLNESLVIEMDHKNVLHASSDESEDPLVSSVAEICCIPLLYGAATSIEATRATTESDLSRTKRSGFRMFSIEDMALEHTESDDELYATYG